MFGARLAGGFSSQFAPRTDIERQQMVRMSGAKERSKRPSMNHQADGEKLENERQYLSSELAGQR